MVVLAPIKPKGSTCTNTRCRLRVLMLQLFMVNTLRAVRQTNVGLAKT